MANTNKPAALPDDPQELKKILQETASKLSQKEQEYKILEDKYKILLHDHFGRKSEKRKVTEDDSDQLLLFNEAELGVDTLEEESLDESNLDEAEKEVLSNEKKALEEHIELKKKQKEKSGGKKGGKQKFPAHLPRVDKLHDLPEEDKAGRPRIGEEVSEELDIKVNVVVIRHIYPVYGERKGKGAIDADEKAVVTAKRPGRIIGSCQYSDNFIAYTMVSKYNNGLPFYRQEQINKSRYNLPLSRSTMCNWAVKLGRKLEDLTDMMKQDIREGPLIQMDETTVQVLKEKNRAVSTKSYMWVMTGRTKKNNKIILFNYFQNRSAKIPAALLEDYVGYLQTDGYKAYDSVASSRGIIHLSCWAHARRYFIKAEKASIKKKSVKVALSFIRQIYLAEEKYRIQLKNGSITEEEFIDLRKKAVLPILSKFKKWLDLKKMNVLPSGKLGEAVAFTLGQWPKLTKYLDTAYATPDNNICENAIRPFVIGRKNWMFIETPGGAYASATLYSLIETARANNLDPFHYFAYIFKQYPNINTKEDLRKLLPYNLTTKDITNLSDKEN